MTRFASMVAGSAALLLSAAALAQSPSTPAPSSPPQRAAAAQGGNSAVRAFVQRFQAANTTHDGQLTLAQAQDGHMPMIVKHFAEIDRGNKGYVTLQDIRDWRRAQAAQRHAAPNSNPGATPG